MPTYEYHCDTCDENFDVVQAFQDEPLTQCPTCGSPVRKVFGSVGIVFKGSGFYKTDSRDGKSRTTGDKAEKGTDGKADADVGSNSTSGTSEAGKPSANGGASSSEGTGGSSTKKGEGSSDKKEKAGASSTGSSTSS